MRNFFISLLLCFTTLPTVAQKTITLNQVKQAGLHIVEITTVNNEEPEGTIVESPLFPGSYNMLYKIFQHQLKLLLSYYSLFDIYKY